SLHRGQRMVVGAGPRPVGWGCRRGGGLRPFRRALSHARGGALMRRYILALDQGTSSSRSIVFDRGGRVVSMAQEEFPQIFPAPGHVEHDPEAIWSSQLATARAALAEGGIAASELAAIGLANQRE